MSARKSEMRRKALLLKLPKDFQEFASWPREARSTIPVDELDRYDGLCKAADLFTKKQSVADLAKAAGMRPFRVLDYIETAIEPWKEGNGITGTRAFVRFKVQSNRVRTADLQPSDPQDAPTAGFSGLFGKLFTDRPAIETKLVEFLNGKQRPNKIGDKTLHTKFQAICKEEGLTDEDYPLRCATKGFRPLLRWFKTKYIPQYLLAHIKKNSGKAAAVTAASLSGDGEARTPFCDYLAWVIDECDSNLEAKVIIPSVRWGGDIVRVRRFPVLRLRSLGDYAMNIAFQVCFTRQAKGADVIKLLKNAVLGQPVPPMVDPNMKPVEGAGFPQDIFEKLKFVVPVVIYLDNALAHLFNDLQEVVMRLFGGRVVLGPPGTPLGRPEVESNIHRTRKCFDLQLPGALGSGPKDPLRQIADCPTEKLVHFNHYEQGLYCQLANENVSDSASAGYTSLSALQTAQAVGSELRNFHKARHVVIDLDLARCRALALGHSALAGSLQELLSVAFSTRSKWAEVHTDFKIFEEALKRMVGQQMLADPDVLASIGGAYMEDRFNICIDDSLVAEEVPVCERVNMTWTGRVTPKEGAHIPGNTLLVVAAVSAWRIGERCFEGPFVEVVRLAVA